MIVAKPVRHIACMIFATHGRQRGVSKELGFYADQLVRNSSLGGTIKMGRLGALHAPAADLSSMCRIKEDHSQPIYCVCFNTLSASCADAFASCGGDRVSSLIHCPLQCCKIKQGMTGLWCHQATIYNCLPAGDIDILQAYVDDDVRPSASILCLRCITLHSSCP